MWTRRAALAASLLTLVSLAGCRRETPPSRETAPPQAFVQVVAGEPLVIGYVTPLTTAISNVKLSQVKVLLEAGADPNVREEDATSWPPLAFAMRGGISEPDYDRRQEMLELLLTHGADPNIRWCDSNRPQCDERTGLTPLMYAATLGDETVTSILLKRGADTSLRDWRGLTAADYWGWKRTRPTSWCLAPITKKSPEPYAASPITDDARWLVDPEYVEQGAPEIVRELRSANDRSVEIIKDERLCEAAAVAYARHRVMEPSEPKPRPVVPVAVVRAGPLWIADDQADGGGKGIFDRSWRILGWFEPPD